MSLKATIEAAQHYLAPEKVDYVLYHSPCCDGAGAALSAWLKLGENASYEKMAYHMPLIESKLRHRNVIMLDCSVRKEQLARLREIAHKVVILDHHDSAKQELAGEPGCFFYMHNSGAVLAWHYFHGLNTIPPRFLQLIQDRDLWSWQEREASEALYYGMTDCFPDLDFRNFARYIEPGNLAQLIEQGKGLIEKNQAWCAKTALKAQRKNFTLPATGQQYRIMCLELENNKLVSELSEYLYTNNDIDFVLLWYRVSGNRYKLSLRNNKEELNLGQIAAQLGGGGHPRAAGAVLDYSPWQLLTD